jgi:dTMP kinase
VLITLEGIEGSGKSTLIASLALHLRAAGTDVLVTHEPGGTPLGDALRNIFLHADLRIEPIAEAFLVNAARAEHVAEKIVPALRAGSVVLCDRFFDSTVAYQGYGRGLDIEMLLRLSLAATQSVAPDLTLLVDIPPEVSRERLAARGAGDRDRVERAGDGFHERVRAGYLELAERFSRIVVLDGLQSPEALLAQAIDVIAHRRHTEPL